MKLTVYHVGQFWVGVLEEESGEGLRASRRLFGAETRQKGVSSKAQLALQLELELELRSKRERKVLGREQRQAELDRKRELKVRKRRQSIAVAEIVRKSPGHRAATSFLLWCKNLLGTCKRDGKIAILLR